MNRKYEYCLHAMIVQYSLSTVVLSVIFCHCCGRYVSLNLAKKVKKVAETMTKVEPSVVALE